jgi:hypothetical protein
MLSANIHIPFSLISISVIADKSNIWNSNHSIDNTFYNVIFYHPVALYRSDLEVFCRLFSISSPYSFIGRYKFRSKWPFSGVQVAMVNESAVHCNAVSSLLF